MAAAATPTRPTTFRRDRPREGGPLFGGPPCSCCQLLPRRRPWDAQAGDLDAGGGLDAGDLDRRVVLLHRNLEVRQGLDEDGVEAHLIAGGDPGGFGGAAAADEGRDDDRDT